MKPPCGLRAINRPMKKAGADVYSSVVVFPGDGIGQKQSGMSPLNRKSEVSLEECFRGSAGLVCCEVYLLASITLCLRACIRAFQHVGVTS